jgi:hypothetical protein
VDRERVIVDATVLVLKSNSTRRSAWRWRIIDMTRSPSPLRDGGSGLSVRAGHIGNLVELTLFLLGKLKCAVMLFAVARLVLVARTVLIMFWSPNMSSKSDIHRDCIK